MTVFTYEKDADGIVTVTMDMDGPVNAVNDTFLPAMGDAVSKLEAEKGLRGVIITSAKDTFFAGGDLKAILDLTEEDVPALFETVQETKGMFRRLEKLPVPVVAAINGSALGGGFELCLGCNYRVASDNPKTKLGLPEVGLGLLPGAGGVVRMTYLLGLQAAMPFLLEGRQVNPAKALEAGLIHKVVPADDLLPEARAWIEKVQGDEAAITQPWDTKGYRIPGGTSNSPKMLPMISGASAMLVQKTKGLMPAPERILDIMAEAAGRLDFDTALRYETRRFVGLPVLPETKNMISTLFFGLNKVNGGASRPEGVPKGTVKKLGVIGAGMMGQGIAYVAANAGIDVVLKDMSMEAAERGKAYTAGLMDKAISRGRKTEKDKDAILNRITATDQKDTLKGCDLIIEAVFERIDLKDQVLEEHEDLLAEGGIWASNTSTLPITRLAAKSKEQGSFVGMHFFSPVDKMPLLELIVGENTSDETLARAFDFARQIRKTPIVVNDSMGFYTSRTIGTKLGEAAQMVAEGLDPQVIDNASRATGLPVGMLTLQDEVKISLTNEIYKTQVKMGLVDPAADPNPEGRAMMFELVDEHGRSGKGFGGGYFDYFDGGKTVWPGLEKWRKPDATIPLQDIKDRIIFRAVIESLKCLEEGVLRSVADANIGSIMGIGAPVQTGGYLQFINTYGLDRFIARCDELAERYGDRFKAPPIAYEHAEERKAFA